MIIDKQIDQRGKQMTKAFKKGDKVSLLGSYDNKGTMFFTDAVVYSCGKKQMVLTDERTGAELGRHFKPTVGDICEAAAFWKATFPRMDEATAVHNAELAGAVLLLSELAKLELKIEREEQRGGDIRFVAALRYELTKLHEPKALRI